MLTEAIMHDCVVKLLKNHDQESLECLCRLFSTIGKDLDFEKAKVSKAWTHSVSSDDFYFCATCLGHWFSDGIEELRRWMKIISLVSNGSSWQSWLKIHFCVPVSLVWISTLTRWTRSSKRKRLHPESASCCKTSWTSERWMWFHQLYIEIKSLYRAVQMVRNAQKGYWLSRTVFHCVWSNHQEFWVTKKCFMLILTHLVLTVPFYSVP